MEFGVTQITRIKTAKVTHTRATSALLTLSLKPFSYLALDHLISVSPKSS